jgi:hypothetical protein
MCQSENAFAFNGMLPPLAKPNRKDRMALAFSLFEER